MLAGARAGLGLTAERQTEHETESNKGHRAAWPSRIDERN